MTEPLQQTIPTPVARLYGEPLIELPQDLYIPPDALEVILDAFEGPLDLLLYLIRKQNLDILDIPMAPLTRQYLEYVEIMRSKNLELAAEYLVMAAMLMAIKSRMLLPRPPSMAEEEEDPRAELVRRLQEYERYKKAAEDVDELPRLERDNFAVVVPFPDRRVVSAPPSVSLDELLAAFSQVVSRASMFSNHHVQREPLSVRERMSIVLERVRAGSEFIDFTTLFTAEEGRAGAVVTLLAILELLKGALIEMVQNEMFGPIYVKAAA